VLIEDVLFDAKYYKLHKHILYSLMLKVVAHRYV